MTFLELEQKCKKRKMFKLLKIFFLIVFIIMISLVLLYFNIKEPKKKKPVTNLSKKTEIKKAAQKKVKIVKPKKNVVNKLEFVIDLNATEPKEKPLKKETVQKKTKVYEKQKKSLPVTKKAFIMKSQTLPSYETCIKLSEKYYKEGDYKQALKWAKNANTQNNKMPDSWILSAKALYKLGKKAEALKVLKIYYNYHKDERVKKLMGEFNESN